MESLTKLVRLTTSTSLCSRSSDATDLEAEVVGRGGRLGVGNDFGVCILDRSARDAVGDDDGVVPPLPDLELHVTADRGDGRCEGERGPVDAMKTERVVCVPQHHHAIAKAA